LTSLGKVTTQAKHGTVVEQTREDFNISRRPLSQYLDTLSGAFKLPGAVCCQGQSDYRLIPAV